MEAATAERPNVKPFTLATVKAAVESEAARLGTPENGQTARLTRKLEKEIIPWNSEDIGFSGLLDPISNPSHVLKYMAQADESEWRNMERDDAVQLGKAKRTNYLLSFGSELVLSDRKTPAAKVLHEAALLNLRSIYKFGEVQRLMLDAIFWGWRPMEIEWELVPFRGRSIYVQKHVRDKKPEDFAFNSRRDLIWQGKFGEERLLTNPSDRFKFMALSNGSLDNPYGLPLYHAVWLNYYLKQRFGEKWAVAVERSAGIVLVKQGLPSGSTASLQTNSEGTAPAMAKRVAEIATETKTALDYLAQTGILTTASGLDVSILADVKASEAWRHPLDLCNTRIELVLTGQTLTSEVRTVGSNAAAVTHLGVLHTYSKSDSKFLEASCNDELLERFFRLNFGAVDPEDKPKLRSKIGSQVSLEAAAAVQRMGAVIDLSRVAEDAGVPLLEGWEQQIPPEQGELFDDKAAAAPQKPTPPGRRKNA